MPLPLPTAPYIRLAKRLVLGPGSLKQVAHHHEIVCPEEKTEIPPAIFLPGQIERITEQTNDSWGFKTRQDAISEAISTTVSHAPTIAYHLKDAVLFDGCIYLGRFKYPIAESSLFRSASRNSLELETAALASSFLGTKYFGHWLTDDCTRYLLAERSGTPLCVRMPPYEHRSQYEQYFCQNWAPTDRGLIRDLIIFQDFSQNSSKQDRYRALRARLRSNFPQTGASEYIYLRRGHTGVSRTVENEQTILDALDKQGFRVIDVGSDGLTPILAPLLNAKLVVSIEGSHLAHCTLALPESSGLLVLEPPDRFSGIHRAQAGSLGIRFAFVVGQHAGSAYLFSVAEILRSIDLLMNAMEK